MLLIQYPNNKLVKSENGHITAWLRGDEIEYEISTHKPLEFINFVVWYRLDTGELVGRSVSAYHIDYSYTINDMFIYQLKQISDLFKLYSDGIHILENI